MRKAVYAIGAALTGLLIRKLAFPAGPPREREKGQHKESSVELMPDVSLRNQGAPVIIPTAMAIAAMTAFRRLSHGNTLRYTFMPTTALSWLLYMAVLRRKRLDSERVTPLYLFALSWQLVHFLEEYYTGFNYRWPTEIFQARPYDDKQFVVINVGSYAVFIIGGIALLKRIPELYLPAIFFAVMGVMFNGIQHPVYSVMVKGYFPGLWTSFLDLALGPALLKRLFFPPTASSV